MKKSRGIGAVFAAMLIVMATIAVPVAMAKESVPPVANENSSGGCTGCTNSGGCSGGIAGNATELQGTEKDKVLYMVLNNKEVQSLQEKLIADGFSQSNIEAYTIPVKTKDGSEINVQVAKVVFKSKIDNTEKNIIFAHDPSSNTTVVTLGSTEDCLHCAAMLAICLGTCVGCVAVCAHPATTWWACSACIIVCGGACAEAILACDKCYGG